MGDYADGPFHYKNIEGYGLEPHSSTPIAASVTEAEAFTVHFSDPAISARFATRPTTGWKLTGKGQILLMAQKLVLRGNRPRPFWTSAKVEIALVRGNVNNVVQMGRQVQFNVGAPDDIDRIVQVWAEDEASAKRLVDRLPTDRTPEFQRLVAEIDSYKAALQSVGTRPVVTPALVALNCLVFIATVVAGSGVFEPNSKILIQWGTNYGPLTLDGEWWRLFTATFLHFGILHLLLNMWALWSLGTLTERFFGSVHYLLLYLFAGMCGSIASLLWNPDVNSAGASGAIFGVIGGLLAFMVNPQTRMPPSVVFAQRNSALVFIGYNLLNGFSHAGIDNAAHIGGLIGGFSMGWCLARPLDQEARANPGRRVLLCTLIGIAALVALSWPLAHPSPMAAAERRFRHQFLLFAENEQAAVAAQKRLQQLAVGRTIADREWGRRIRDEVLPKWQVAEAAILAAPLPADSPLFPLRIATLQYLTDRQLALSLQSHGAQFGDSEEFKRGSALNIKIATDAGEVAGLARYLK
jgi:rhomboid protease GluP